MNGDSSSIKFALIAAFGLILSTSIPAILATFNRTKVQPTTEVPEDAEGSLARELRRRAEAAEAECEEKDSKIERLERRAELYERVLIKDGHDPDLIVAAAVGGQEA